MQRAPGLVHRIVAPCAACAISVPNTRSVCYWLRRSSCHSDCRLHRTGTRCGDSTQHSHISAVSELLSAHVMSWLVSAACSTVLSAPRTDIPALRHQELEEAAVVGRWDAAVCSPPPPLQSAGSATQIRWDLEAHPVRAGAWRQVPPLGVVRLDRLAVAPGIVGNTIAWPIRAAQLPGIKARLRICKVSGHMLITNGKLKVTPVVGSDVDLKLLDACLQVSHCLSSVIQEVSCIRPLPPIAANAGSIAAVRAVTVVVVS
mmetsp:Transcript_4058/g.8700  ORF Transcript_4058/g.8700 Transcript_4058/m.8700 type:complete len:259 (+) Transcript_4058:1451-2227(+)